MSSSGAPGCRQNWWDNVIPGRELNLREWRDLTKISLLVSGVAGMVAHSMSSDARRGSLLGDGCALPEAPPAATSLRVPFLLVRSQTTPQGGREPFRGFHTRGLIFNKEQVLPGDVRQHLFCAEAVDTAGKTRAGWHTCLQTGGSAADCDRGVAGLRWSGKAVGTMAFQKWLEAEGGGRKAQGLSGSEANQTGAWNRPQSGAQNGRP